MEAKNESLLEIHDLSVSFRMYDHALEQHDLQVISDLHLTVRPGEVVAIAGSSGSGKSLLASAILGILPGNATVHGHLHYKGSQLTPERQAQLRGTEIALVPQSIAYLDPLMKVGKQADGHRKPRPRKTAKAVRPVRFAGEDGTALPLPAFRRHGRRVLVSTALITDAQLIIADEPTPGIAWTSHGSPEAVPHPGGRGPGRDSHYPRHRSGLCLCRPGGGVLCRYHGGDCPGGGLPHRAGALRHPYSQALWRALPQNGFERCRDSSPMREICPRAACTLPGAPTKPGMRTGGAPGTNHPGREVRCYHGA